jgi:hypothetical protein
VVELSACPEGPGPGFASKATRFGWSLADVREMPPVNTGSRGVPERPCYIRRVRAGVASKATFVGCRDVCPRAQKALVLGFASKATRLGVSSGNVREMPPIETGSRGVPGQACTILGAFERVLPVRQRLSIVGISGDVRETAGFPHGERRALKIAKRGGRICRGWTNSFQV